MRVTKKRHHMWIQYDMLYGKYERYVPRGHEYLPEPMIGEWQYIYESEDGTNIVSLIELPNYFRDGITLWEAYCIHGTLFDGEVRFDSKNEAEKYITEEMKEPLTTSVTDLDNDHTQKSLKR